MRNDRIERILPQRIALEPDEIERAQRRAARLRAQAFRDVSRAFGEWLAQIDRKRRLESERTA
jgi:hypothetical protein